MGARGREFKPFPEYFVFKEVELFSLILCIVLDISEYVAAVLLMPGVGDVLDFVGIFACLVMFRWVGFVSLFELVPGVDILPIFIITWLVWYFLKKQKRRETILYPENGKYNPPLKLAHEVARILKTTIDNLLIFEDQEENINQV